MLFIPWWGSIGAAISTAIALLIYNLGRMIFVYVVYKIHPFSKEQIWVIILGILTLSLGIIIDKYFAASYLNLFIKVGLLGLTFLLPIYIFKLEKESINYIKKITGYLKRRPNR